MHFKTTIRILFITLSGSIALADSARISSPQAVVADPQGKVLYVGEKTARLITRISSETGKAEQHHPLPGRPNGLTVSSDGRTLYATVEEADGRVYVLDAQSGAILKEIKTGHTPMAPTLSPDEQTLYVCNRFNNGVAIIDLASGKTTHTIPVVREPIAMALTKDGRLLFVANHLPAGAANVDRMTSVISVIDTGTQSVVKNIPLPNGAISLREMALSPDGKRLYVPSIFARFLVPTTQIERGWINTHALNIVDVDRQELIHTLLLDDVTRGAANPWGVACSPDNRHIVVAHSATHELSIIDRDALEAKLSEVPRYGGTKEAEKQTDNPMNNLGFLFGTRRRVALKGNGPRNVVIIGDKAYVTEYFSGSLGVVSLDPAIKNNVRSVSLGPQSPMDQIRLGEMHFNDATLCFQQWQSCSTCHPDVRTDAVSWDLLNDGFGNPKSTKSLLLAHATPPVMITGIRADAETAVRAGIRHIQFAPANEEKALAMDAFLKSLEPVPSPYLVDGQLSEAAERGKKLFMGDTGCIQCHSGKYFTSMQKYDAGTGTGREKGVKFDTPTLIESWRTAPYLYDGRAATLTDVFRTYNPDDLHGGTSLLTDEELADLIEYVQSL